MSYSISLIGLYSNGYLRLLSPIMLRPSEPLMFSILPMEYTPVPG